MFDYRKVDEIVSIIAKKLDPEMIIIFGSVARGEANEYSDLDMVIIMNTDVRYIRRPLLILEHISKIDIPMDLIVLTPEEYEQTKGDEYSFTSKIAKEGRVVYAKG